VILLLESSGIPIANNTLLLFTGALTSFGHLNILVLAIVAIVGSISGACLAYVIGLRGGRRFLFRVSNRLHIDAQKINKAERWFHRTGARMIFLSRVTPYIRPFACFPAGMTRMPRSRIRTGRRPVTCSKSEQGGGKLTPVPYNEVACTTG